MKRFLISIMTLSLVLMCPVLAEESEMEMETETEIEIDSTKGSRMNPYEFDDNIQFRMYTEDETGAIGWAEVTMKFDEQINQSENGEISFTGVLEIGSANVDDRCLGVEIAANLLSTDLMDTYVNFGVYSSSEEQTYAVYSDMNYSYKITTSKYDSVDLSDYENGYIRILYIENEENVPIEDPSYIWVKLPETFESESLDTLESDSLSNEEDFETKYYNLLEEYEQLKADYDALSNE